jgi:hypothetical protein
VRGDEPLPEGINAVRRLAPKPQLARVKITVYAIGTAMVRVTGPIAGGDLIQSSATPGVAERQPDDIVRTVTAGKVLRGDGETGERLVACVLYSG